MPTEPRMNAVLTPEAVTRAWRLAAAHHHTWGGLSLEAVLALPVLTPAAIDALSRATFEAGPCGWGETAPQLDSEGQISWRTGSGRAMWSVAPDGTVFISIWRAYHPQRHAAEMASIREAYAEEERETRVALGYCVLSVTVTADGAVTSSPWTQDDTADLRPRHLETAQDLVMAALGKHTLRAADTEQFQSVFGDVTTWVAEAEAARVQALVTQARALIGQLAGRPGAVASLGVLASATVLAAHRAGEEPHRRNAHAWSQAEALVRATVR